MKLGKMVSLVALFALIIAPQAHAIQLAPGTIMISGNSNFHFGTAKQEVDDFDQTITNFGLMVQGGYFVINNLEAVVLFDFDTSTYENGDKVTTTAFTLGAGANYYFDLQSELFPYAGAFLGFMSEKTKNGYEESINGVLFGLQGGIKYFLNDNFAVDAGLRLTFGSGDYEEEYNNNSYSGDADMTEFELYAGIAVLL